MVQTNSVAGFADVNLRPQAKPLIQTLRRSTLTCSRQTTKWAFCSRDPKAGSVHSGSIRQVVTLSAHFLRKFEPSRRKAWSWGQIYAAFNKRPENDLSSS